MWIGDCFIGLQSCLIAMSTLQSENRCGCLGILIALSELSASILYTRYIVALIIKLYLELLRCGIFGSFLKAGYNMELPLDAPWPSALMGSC